MDEHNSGRNHTSSPAKSSEHKGVGFGIFLLLAGLVLLGEKLGWWPNGIDWLFPVILIAWGASEIYNRSKST